MTEPKYNTDWAIEEAKKPKTKCVFFWSHKGSADTPGPHVFSQWFPAGFAHRGIRYPTAEHWMMAEKARLFGDKDAEDQILSAKEPGKAKSLGRAVRAFDQARWSRAAYGIVLEGSILKFRKNKALRRYILETGSKILVEASPTDPIWGIGMARNDPEAGRPERWNGTNLLGFALMEARDILREGAA